MILAIDALLDLADRYRAEALRMERDDLAETLARVPRHGATTFLEALQAFRFSTSRCGPRGSTTTPPVGSTRYSGLTSRPIWRPAAWTREGAFDLLVEFFLTFNRDSDLYPGVQQGDNGQSLVLGGITRDGKNGFNPLSEMCLRASKELLLIDPKINLRVDGRTPPEIYQPGTELTREGPGFPQLWSVGDQLVPVRWRGEVGGLACAEAEAEAEDQYRLPPVRPPGKSHMVRPSVLRHRRSSTSRYTPAW